MSTFRVNKTNNYTVMSNYHLRDKNLSMKAKGLLSIMLSLPNDWDYSVAGLVTLSSDGETAVRTALTELETNKYLIRERVYENGKIADWVYNIYEQPYDTQVDENLVGENQILGFSGQINTNKQNTEKTNKAILSKDNIATESEQSFDFGKPIEQPKKKNMYQQCLDIINGWTNDLAEIDLLKLYLDELLEFKYLHSAKQWSGMVTKTLVNAKQKSVEGITYADIIQRSIDHCWKTFYPVDGKFYSSAKTNSKECISDFDNSKENHKKSERSF